MPICVLNQLLSPLLGVDMNLKNNLPEKFDYKKSRTLTMNFADYQMIENKSEQFTIGLGYKIKGLKLPIKIRGRNIRLDNDLSFRFDFSYRDNINVNHRIDESQPQITQGSRVIFINPTIDYIVSKRLNIRVFFEQTQTIPKISTGFPTTNTKGGVTLRFSLAE
jgi:cell surface protein SprA